MKNSISSLLWVRVFCAVFSANALCWDRGAAKDHANTPIRVLLERHTRRVDVRSLSGPLQARIDHGPLLTVPHALIIEKLSDGRVMVNGRTQLAQVIHIETAISHAHMQISAQVHVGEIFVRNDLADLMVINQLPLESYLKGTLAAEMNPSWNLEALKAQAIASRSFARDAIRHTRHPHYDIEATTDDQVFSGAGLSTPRIDQAVRETEGLVLWDHTRPLKAYFHSRCGGSTQAATEVWPHSTQDFPSVECQYCRLHPTPWKTTVRRDELTRVFGVASDTKEIVLSATRNPSGRVTELTLVIDDLPKSLPLNTLRARLGYKRFRSALFDWHVSQEGISFEGRGFGHGVGLCQWGAQYLARQGLSFLSILRHYYPHARIARG